MIAVKKQVLIPPSRHLELDLPQDTPEGMAEVIVLVPGPSSPRAAPLLTFPDIPEEDWEEAEKAIQEARGTDRLRSGDDP
jgi:hypothetical protein